MKNLRRTLRKVLSLVLSVAMLIVVADIPGIPANAEEKVSYAGNINDGFKEEVNNTNDSVKTNVYINTYTIVHENLGDLSDIGLPVSIFGITDESFTDRYYNQLEPDSKLVYDTIMNSSLGTTGASLDKISIPYEKIWEKQTVAIQNNNLILQDTTKAEIKEWIDDIVLPAWLAVIYEHPELSWFAGSGIAYSYSYSAKMQENSSSCADITVKDIVLYMTESSYNTATTGVNATGNMEDIKGAVAAAKSALEAAPYNLKDNSTVYDKVKAIHDYLCNTVQYANGDLGPRRYQTAYSALVSPYITVCAGYSKAFKLLCNEFSVDCVLVSGQGGSPGSMQAHMWNYVHMDNGKWYAVDCTWDDQTEKSTGQIFYDFFLSGADTVPENFTKIKFNESHIPSGVWASDSPYVFNYPSLSQNNYDTNYSSIKNDSYGINYIYSGKAIPAPKDKDFSVNGSKARKYTFSWYKGDYTDGQDLSSVQELGSEPVNAGMYTLKVDAAAEEHLPADTLRILVNVGKAELTEDCIGYKGNISESVYTGKPVIPEIEKKEGIGEVKLKYKHITSKDFIDSIIDAGYYDVYAEVGEGENYKASDGLIQLYGFTITPASLQDNMFEPLDGDYYVMLKPVEPEVKAADGFDIKKGRDYEVNYHQNTYSGTARATVTGKGNYKGSVDIPFTISRKYIDGSMYTITGTEGKNGWYISNVQVSAAKGYSFLHTIATPENVTDKFSYDTDGKNTCSFFMTDKEGYLYHADPVKYPGMPDVFSIPVNIDTKAPHGEISILNTGKLWQSFLEVISLGYYTNEEQKIRIFATDENTSLTKENVSGVDTIEYYITTEKYTTEEQLESAVSGKWNTYDDNDMPVLKADSSNIVYAKITDVAGNVSYVSTDEIIQDSTAPVINNVEASTGNMMAFLKLNITETGSGIVDYYVGYEPAAGEPSENIIKGNKKNLNEDGDIELINLSPDTEYNYGIIVTDKAGNDSDIYRGSFRTGKNSIYGTANIKGVAEFGNKLSVDFQSTGLSGTYLYTWYRDDEIVSGPSASNEYLITEDDIGHSIKAEVSSEEFEGSITDIIDEKNNGSDVVLKMGNIPAPEEVSINDSIGIDTYIFKGYTDFEYEYSIDGGKSWNNVEIIEETEDNRINGSISIGNFAYGKGQIYVRAKETNFSMPGDILKNSKEFTAELEGTVSITGKTCYNGIITAEVKGVQNNAELIYTFLYDGTNDVVQEGTGNSYLIKGEDIGKSLIVHVSATNYNGILKLADAVVIEKADFPPNMPSEELSASNSCEKVSDIMLETGWEWDSNSGGLKLETGKAVSAKAVYTAADKEFYKNLTVTVLITRSSCEHIESEVLYDEASGEKAPTCTDKGNGHKECTICNEILVRNIITDELGHTGGSASCVKKAVCVRCGAAYGELDSSKHSNLVIKNIKEATDTEDGYTGDTYCDDCGVKVSEGEVIKATGTATNPPSLETQVPGTPIPGTSAPATPTPVPPETPSGTKTPVPGFSGGYYPVYIPSGVKTPVPAATPTVKPAATKTPAPAPSAVKTPAPSPSGVKTPVPAANASATPIPIPQVHNTPVPGNLPSATPAVKGIKVRDDSAKAVCTITKQGKNPEVAYERPIGDSSKVVIPDVITVKGTVYKVTSIKSNAFAYAGNVQKIVIGKNINYISNNAFKNCKNITTIIIDTSKLKASNVGKKAFKGLGVNRKVVIKVPGNKYKKYKKIIKMSGIGKKSSIKKR